MKSVLYTDDSSILTTLHDSGLVKQEFKIYNRLLCTKHNFPVTITLLNLQSDSELWEKLDHILMGFTTSYVVRSKDSLGRACMTLVYSAAFNILIPSDFLVLYYDPIKVDDFIYRNIKTVMDRTPIHTCENLLVSSTRMFRRKIYQYFETH